MHACSLYFIISQHQTFSITRQLHCSHAILLVQVAQSNSVWESLYNKRWCDATAPNDAAPQSDQAVQLSWHDKYRQKHSAEHHMQCPRCRQSKVVPIVYGFPSHLLVRNMRANKLRMGNDHLIEGQPIWTCTHCNEEFANFPYKSHELIRTWLDSVFHDDNSIQFLHLVHFSLNPAVGSLALVQLASDY